MPDAVTFILVAVMVLGLLWVLVRSVQAVIYFQKRADKRIRALHAQARREEAASAAQAE
ncbi:hypothetical protein [Roseospira visakhapatnamensis]|uniref:Uncharacterized protein n=1 Tax=Roseospira visakhapatnamensis TaxID=390880 RepID=A0A7W6REU8_9PROT|nr:hypothetical protein [Roseospira visakhapatnamensis]MBB4266638.1 hypothetical protein [Roseospira visakhapatnamensis]